MTPKTVLRPETMTEVIWVQSKHHFLKISGKTQTLPRMGMLIETPSFHGNIWKKLLKGIGL